MSPVDLVSGLLVAVGLVGILVPVLPGTLLVLGGVLLWAVLTGGPTAWLVLAVVAVVLGVGLVLTWLIPGRRLQGAGVPTSSLAWGAAAAVVGFFVVPVIGLVLGFLLGVYVAESRRGTQHAARATIAAVRAVVLAMGIELAAGLLAAGVWVTGVVVT